MRFISYDYVCSACDHSFNHLQEPGNDLTKCPKCGKLKLKRQFPAPAVHMLYSPCHPRAGRGMSKR